MGIIANLFRKKENKYDHIISLGYNCEVTYRFLKYFKFEESSLFNWCHSRNIDNLIRALNDFNLIGYDFTNPNPLWECKETHIRFHGKAPMSIYIDKTATKEELENDKKELISRIAYLKKKFIDILTNDSKKLYIYKIKTTDINKDTNTQISKLKSALSLLGGKNFEVLIVSEKEANFTTKQGNYIHRTVEYYAPDNDVTSKKYFKNGWNKIFDEFYQTKIKAKKKKYKFGEI